MRRESRTLPTRLLINVRGRRLRYSSARDLVPSRVQATRVHMDLYINSMSSPPILAAHHVSSGQNSNSLQGALKNGSDVKRLSTALSKSPSMSSAVAITEGNGVLAASRDQDMQRQLEDYNRSITIVIWYKADTEPIRLQHMNATFPYFQLLQLSSLTTDLGLTPASYIDAFDPHSGKWEQHTMSSVRLVATQQRLLYKTRRNLLEGLSEQQCLGLTEEVHGQSKVPRPPAPKLEPQNKPTPLKRSSPEGASSEPPQKVHIPNTYYTHTQRLVAPGPSSQPLQDTPIDPIAPSTSYAYPPPVFYPPPDNPTSTPAPAHTSTPEATLPSHLTNPDAIAPAIPYHPHPPLKRWPNDYTVAELTAGFNAMELLIRQPPPGANGTATPMTQRTAFERVFGSRYVKSTVCRHRGVWRKASGPLREQFEAMGADERACWGEFVRRIEGRPPSKAVVQGMNAGAGVVATPQPQMQGVIIYHAQPPGEMVGLHGVAETMQSQTIPRRVETEKAVVNEPLMASLQNPDEQDGSLQSGQFP